MYKKIVVLITLILMLSFNFANLTTDLVSYYDFEEASGDLKDKVGTLDLTSGSVTYQQTGVVDYGQYFTKSSGYSSAATGLPLTDFTYSIWFKSAVIDGEFLNPFIFSITNASAYFGLWIHSTPSGNTNKVEITYNGTTEVTTIDGTSNASYQHLVITQTNSNIKYYLNGSLLDNFNVTELTGDSTNIYLGQSSSSHEYKGDMDEFGIWNRVLTSTEITELYNSGAGLTYPFGEKNVDANFDYVTDKTNAQIILEDTSTVVGATEITQWTYLLDDTNIYYSIINGDYNYTVTELTDYNIGLRVDTNNDSNRFQYYQFNTGDWTAPTTTLTDNGQTAGTANYSLDLNCTDNNIGCEYINFSIDGGDYNYYLIGDNPLNIIVNGSGDHNIAYFSSDFNDNNEAVNNYDFTTYGAGQISFYDETNSDLNEITYSITPSINGVTSGITTLNSLDFNFQGITSGTYTFTFSKTGYTTKNFNLDLNEYSKIDYNFVFIAVDDTSSVDFQVFNESGTTQKNTKFFAFDFDLNKYVDIKTTDSLGRMTMKLNETKSDYNFFSSAFNFGTTTWTIAKPKDAITLVDITGNWKYSITGASYSSGTNIVAGVQKLLLQNTVNPYYIQIQDVDETYAPSNFGLQSITTENDKNLNPYLYLYSQADLKLIKLLRYSTNIPISEPYELDLSVYTDSNGLIPIGTFINDSTGTYNIYMDSNAHYRLEIGSETFELSPTLGVYYVYLSQDIGIEINNTILDTNDSFTDSNLPNIFLEVREFAFGCSITETNCYESATFSIIAIILLTIIFIALIPSSPLQQTIITASLLSLFTAISFIPLWLFGITIVIIIAWGIFS